MPDPAVQRDPLFAQILMRHTNRNLYDIDRPVPADAWKAMAEAVKPNPLRFGFVSTDQADVLKQHRAIAAEAWRIELTTPRTMLESYKVLRVGAAEIEQYRDGLSVLDPMVVLLNRVGLFDRSKAPAPDDFATTSQIKDFGKKLESTPGFLWMVTEGNDRVTQVNAGRAYARVQLAATAHGVAMQPLQQALQEYPEAGQALRRHPASSRRAAAGPDRADVGPRGLCAAGRSGAAPRRGGAHRQSLIITAAGPLSGSWLVDHG